MANISAPKIPDGEKVDFDVSQPHQTPLCLKLTRHISHNVWFFDAGYLQETSGEGSS